jgi:16S rRNA (cytosine967-C5)-methyltransferase
MGADVRALAARTLAQVVDAGQSLNQALPSALEQAPEGDRALLRELCYGTLRFAPRWQALLRALLARPLKRRDGDLWALLMLGLYQIAEMRLPDHAAVNTTVDACNKLGKSWARGLVNAVLRRYLREREALEAALDPAAAAAHPRWLFDLITAQWPLQRDRIVDANNRRPPMTLRVNIRRLTRDAYLQRLAGAGIEAVPCRWAEQGVRLARPVDTALLPGFADGEVSVQDEGAQLAASLLPVPDAARVLDACAAPGGKTCHLLERYADIATMQAMDNDPQRLQRLRDNLARLGLTAQLLAGDAAHPPATLAASSLDTILVDAPCSASGVIRRHPDVKLLRRASDLGGFARAQLSILQGMWPLLRLGGSLLYATCSILEQENDAVIDGFLALTADARVEDIHAAWGEPTRHGRQLLPDAEGPDGLFYCLLRKG